MSDTTAVARLGFVGLGNMGAPMAARLVDWPGGLSVFDVRTDAMSRLAEAGAILADRLPDVAAAADIICVAVLDDAQVRTVVAELAVDATPGTIIAIHSTISDVTATELAKRYAPQGIHIADAPVSGGAGAAEKGQLATMIGAARPIYEQLKPVFKQWSSLVIHAGAPGAGTRMKLARNMLTFTCYAAVGEAMQLADAAGLDLHALGRVVRHTDALTGGPGAVLIRDSAAPLPADHFLYQALSHTCELGEKDLRLALALGEANGVVLPLARLALRRLAISLGVGTDDEQTG